jgi:pimeloyl-ACP methyl ester carboxylesterase
MQLDCSDEGSGDAVILIHGGASNNRQWKSLIADLKPYFRVIAPNLHGAGKTPSWQGPNAYRLADAAALIERVCESIVGGVSLVGHSVGGAVAMQAAARLGARVEKLLLLEAAPYDLLRQAGAGGAYREALALYEFVRDGSERGEWAAIAERFLNAFVGTGAWEKMSDEKRARAVQLMHHNRAEWDSLMNDRTTLREWGSRLPHQTLFVSAADTWPPLRALTELFVKGCPHWTFAELPEGGHMAPLYRPDLVNPIICEFLKFSSRLPARAKHDN